MALRRRPVAGGDPAPAPTQGGDHRGGLRWPGRRRRATPGRHRRSGDHRGRRRRRGNLAAQHLSRRRVRHPEPPLLVLVRAQQIVEPHLRSAARDPGLPRIGGRRLRSPPAPDAGDQGALGPLERRDLGLPAGPRRACRQPDRGRRRVRRRIVRRPKSSRHRGTDRLHRNAHAHRAVGSPRRPGGQEGGGHRHRRERGPGRSRTGQDRPARQRLSTHTAVDGAKDDRPYSPPELARFHRNPLAVRRTRWQIWKFQHDNTATFADDPVVTARTQVATSFWSAPWPTSGCAGR